MTSPRWRRRYGRPVDVEWVWDGERVTYVQLRPITTIGSVSYYSNRFSREVLPGRHPAARVVGEHPHRQRRVDPTARAARRPDRARARRPGGTHLLARLLQHGRAGHRLRHLGRPARVPRDSERYREGEGRRPQVRLTLKPLRQDAAGSRSPRVSGYEQRAVTGAADLRRSFSSLRGAVDLDRSTPERCRALDALSPRCRRPPISTCSRRCSPRRTTTYSLDGSSAMTWPTTPSTSRTATAATTAATRPPPLELHELSLSLRSAAGAPSGRRRQRGAIGRRRRALRGSLDRFIEIYGHFSDSGNDFSHVPWREDPAAVVRPIGAQSGGRSSTRE